MTESLSRAASADRSLPGDGVHIGTIQLAQGVTYRHAWVALYSSLTTMSLLVYINLIQPYLFIKVLELPMAQLGAATGRLASLHETVAIVSMLVIGALSDRLGRRLIYSAGFLLMGSGYFLYPLADTLVQLAVFRSVFAIGGGIVLVMFTVLAIDYSQEVSRGKWIGLLNLGAGIGVLIMTLVMSRIPGMLERAGYEGSVAGRYVFWIASTLCMVTAIVLALGLKKTRPAEVTQQPRFLATALKAFKLAAKDRKLAVGYAAAFVGRGDLVIIGMFLPLWVAHAGQEMDMSPAAATARAGTLLFVNQLAVVAWAFAAGYLNDRFDKLTLLGLAFVVASAGYFGLWWVDNPFSNACFVAVFILAIGEISIVVTNNALVGERAPVDSRGSVFSVVGVAGAIGIALATLLGGEVFDRINVTAPFLMMIGLNLVVIVWILLVKGQARGGARPAIHSGVQDGRPEP
jgi:MFS family permease